MGKIEILEQMGMDIDILETIECERSEWYGHVERINDQRWSKRLSQRIPTNRRKRGRPRIRGRKK